MTWVVGRCGYLCRSRGGCGLVWVGVGRCGLVHCLVTPLPDALAEIADTIKRKNGRNERSSDFRYQG